MSSSYNRAVIVRIRDFRRADFMQLWRIDQECFAPEISYTRAELAHYMARRGAFTLVAETAEGRPVIAGFMVGECDRRGLGHVITIDVAEHARRTGSGSQLMAAAEARMQSAGCKACYLETAVDNIGAIKFYECHGYTVLRTIPHYYMGKIDAFLMGKRF